MIEVQVNIDCADADALQAFYCEALGYRAHGNAGQYRSCMPGAGVTGPKIVFQQVPEAKAVEEAAVVAGARRNPGQCRTRVRARRLLDRDARPRGQRDLPVR